MVAAGFSLRKTSATLKVAATFMKSKLLLEKIGRRAKNKAKRKETLMEKAALLQKCQ